MKQYLDLLQNILDNGREKESGRTNMPNTIGISNAIIRMDMKDGFPLLTTKKMFWKGIVHELLWFLRGDTNIKYLVDNNVNIWNGDAYRWYLKHCEDNEIQPFFKTIEQFIDFIKNIKKVYYDSNNFLRYEVENPDGIQLIHLIRLSEIDYQVGDLGKVYGHQWRNQNGVDQVRDVIEGLRDNPYSRYHILDGWNKADFKDMALPPCHLLYQFIVRPLSQEEREEWFFQNVFYKEGRGEYVPELIDSANTPKFYLDLNMYQRSVDTMLGCPFNIASMSLLLMIMAKVSNMIPGVSTWIGGDTHLYVDHIPMVKEQLSREPLTLPELEITKEIKTLEDIENLTINDFQLNLYTHHDTIKAELFTGLKN